MDNSQSSDIFMENSDSFEDGTALHNNECYKSLLSRTKKFLSMESNIKESTFHIKFSSALEDCCDCIKQCLAAIENLLEDGEIQLDMLCGYMEDAISLIQMLSYFIKNVIESIALSCAILKNFPIATGHIILTIYTHCKDSEYLYGTNVNGVERQLKDLFRTCHELQLTYLMTLEKHFIFDMTKKEEQNVLLEALDINLRIGEIVQTLDVKTMAEQWKAYIAICEKYATSLMDKTIYNKCSQLLCSMIESNMAIALERDEDDKIVLRSLKVASFTLKILLKVSSIFKHATENNYEHVFHLLIFIYSRDGSILEGMFSKSQQFTGQVNMLISNPTHALLSQLICDEKFSNQILHCDITQLKDDKPLGYILLLISTIRSVLLCSEDPSILMSKYKLLECVFSIIPYSGFWFNIGLSYRNKDGDEACEIEEYFLTHTTALCMCLKAEDFTRLERHMYEALLSTDTCSALFTYHLWVLLARVAPRQYTLNTLVSLCEIYKTLETATLFHGSPQKVHLGNTINRLFEILPNEDKLLIHRQFDVRDERLYGLWSVLKISNLPTCVRATVEKNILDRLLEKLDHLVKATMAEERDIDGLINTITVFSSCSFVEINAAENILRDCLVRAWMKACPKTLLPLPGHIYPGLQWYLKYVEALITLSNPIMELFFDFDNDLKVYNILVDIILTGNQELILISIPTFCIISFFLFDVFEDNSSLELITMKTLKYLLLETDELIKQCMFSEFVKYRGQEKFESVILKVFDEIPDLQKEWNDALNQKDKDIAERKKCWAPSDCVFVHKCVKNNIHIEASQSMKTNKSQSNFELDIDNLFDGESDSDEPEAKKAKLDCNGAEEIIKRLEDDSSLLSRYNEISNEGKKD